ncbi:hypothetical protein [Natronorarus salvus]|uniref:hypothetical protein n=1 Tax=Natronorarus salvus TaxID=3117733 RepID=UPI002F26837D
MNPPPSRPPRKTTLHCSECAHESPADGDWIVYERSDATSYGCPDCGTEIARQRRFDRPPIAAAADAWTATWTHGCTGLVRLWRSLLV